MWSKWSSSHTVRKRDIHILVQMLWSKWNGLAAGRGVFLKLRLSFKEMRLCPLSKQIRWYVLSRGSRAHRLRDSITSKAHALQQEVAGKVHHSQPAFMGRSCGRKHQPRFKSRCDTPTNSDDVWSWWNRDRINLLTKPRTLETWNERQAILLREATYLFALSSLVLGPLSRLLLDACSVTSSSSDFCGVDRSPCGYACFSVNTFTFLSCCSHFFRQFRAIVRRF